MTIVQLFASPFFGGPERQMLGLSLSLPPRFRSVFVSFSNGGRCRPLLDRASERHLETIELKHDFPHLIRSVREVAAVLRDLEADVVCCNGYKPDIVGWIAARCAGVPVVSISHGWTGATLRVRVYETLDRLLLRGMDAVVSVSAAQAERVRRAGTRAARNHVIRNAVNVAPFAAPDPAYRELLQKNFKLPKSVIVGAAGRLSPEKGFEVLVDAAAQIAPKRSDVGFVVFGAGPLREELQQKIAALGLADHLVLAGFREDVEKFIPHFDIAVLPSYTEGLPIFVLEALAARVPVVATAVGGTPEVVDEGKSGLLTPSGNPTALAGALLKLVDDPETRKRMGTAGRARIDEEFTFQVQCEQYAALFDQLASQKRKRMAAAPVRCAPQEL